MLSVINVPNKNQDSDNDDDFEHFEHFEDFTPNKKIQSVIQKPNGDKIITPKNLNTTLPPVLKDRNKNMFGSILNHLGKAKQRLDNDSEKVKLKK